MTVCPLQRLAEAVWEDLLGSNNCVHFDYQVSAATKIHGVEWEVKDEERRPSCVVKMKTNRDDTINIEMDHETLTTMVDSLVKIRQQISSVVS